jgi:hypothetical protein
LTNTKRLSTAGSNSLANSAAHGLARDLFGPPPLITDEEPAEYELLAERVIAAVRPRNTLERIWVRDVVDLVWEARRLRRLKTSLLQAVSHMGVYEFLLPRIGPDQATKFSNRSALGYPAIEVEVFLTNAALPKDALTALTFERKLESFERIDRLIASAEARRNNALREIDRHRAALGAAVRAVVEEVEDAVFTDVETGQTVGVPQ